MFTSLASVRTDLDARLTAVLPDGWETVPNLEESKKALHPVLYFEFVKFTSSANGQPFGRGQVGAQIDLTIASKETDTVKAEDSVDQHVLTLAQALQMYSDIYWDTAEKTRLKEGQIGWKVSITVITAIPIPPSTEG